MKNDKNDVLWRVYALYAAMLLFGIAVVIRIAFIQIKEGSELKDAARNFELKMFEIEAVRGNILSDNGSLLATSVPVFSLHMDVCSPHIDDDIFNSNVDSLAICLSNLFNKKSKSQYLKELKRAREHKKRYLSIADGVTYSQLKKVKKFPILRLGRFKGGLIVDRSERRERPFKELAARTIGYVNEKGTESEKVYVGIEGAYHDILKGVDGQQLKRRINKGDWVSVNDGSEIEPKNGNDVVTTIDINIQDVATSALRKTLIENNAEQGCALLMEVETGYIKAIVNLMKDKKGNYVEAYNYAIRNAIEPGSTFKLASIMALLEDNKINLNDTINIGRSGEKKFHNRTMRDSHVIRNGKVTIREAFEQSSNIGISTLVYDNYAENPEKFVEHLYRMSLNAPLNIDIQGASNPYIKNTKDKTWSKVSLPWMSIGYEVALTPIQMLTFYNAVANNGRMMKPQFVKEICQSGTVIKTFDPVVINESIASQHTIDSAKSLMEGVVKNGTARRLKNSPFQIAGKTGTSQISQGKGGYNKSNYTSSFIGYFPAKNPKYSCLIIVSNPSEGRIYGGAVSAPAFQEIANKVYATRLDMHDIEVFSNENVVPSIAQTTFFDDAMDIYETFGVECVNLSEGDDWVKVEDNELNKSLNRVAIEPETIPDVKGMGCKDAVYLLENMGVKTSVSGKGHVAWQSVEPGSTLIKNQIVELKLSNL